ncbi:MAG TPA: LCP family protein [Firmicutes bacterium]|nr:LCP family protein [Bacillota bacterium]
MAKRISSSRKRAKRRAVLFIGSMVFLFLLIGFLAGTYSFLRGVGLGAGVNVNVPAVEPGERINVLLLGIDADRDADGNVVPSDLQRSWTRTDVMIMLSFDPATNELGMLSLPRDTRVHIPGHGTEKLAHAHAYGGPQLAIETVSEFLDVPIHYYVRTNFAGFISMVDILGGVDLQIDEHMYYEDPTQDLVINIPAGLHHFDGAKALDLVRYRQYWDGDIGRVKMQQRLINALLDEVFQVGIVFKLPSMAGELLKYVDTNMDPGQLLSLANTARKMDRSKITMEMLPGHLGEIYWEPDHEQIVDTVDRLLKGIDRGRNARIELEVLNGCKVAGAAASLTAALRQQGFNVISYGNAEQTNNAKTYVSYNGAEAREAAGSVALAISRLGIPVRVVAGRTDEAQVPVTVVIGADIEQAEMGGKR